MAMNHLFAFSASVKGAIIAAGNPYGCGAFKEGHTEHGGACYYGGNDLAKLKKYIESQYKRGLIDNPENLANTSVLLFNGKNDWMVYTKGMKEAGKQLRMFMQPDRVVERFKTKAAHVWSLDHGKCKCGSCSGADSVCCDYNNCHYDLSGESLGLFFNSVQPRVNASQQWWLWIDQHKYLPARNESQWKQVRLKRWCPTYVPGSCRKDPGSCPVHIHYHGCIDNDATLRMQWINNLDLNEYAESNGIIVMYPQATGDYLTGVGCWNWGHKGDDKLFDTKQSAQMRTVIAMLQDLPTALAEASTMTMDQYLAQDNGEEKGDYNDYAIERRLIFA